ncbi:MAG: hypothetical protein ACOX4I_03715 [Anaerovoracaceae bacterium]
MSGFFVPGEHEEFIEQIEDPDLRKVASAESHYFRSEYEMAVHHTMELLDHEDPAIRNSAIMLFSFANLPLGNTKVAWQGLAKVMDFVENIADDAPEETKALGVFFGNLASVYTHQRPYDREGLSKYTLFLPRGTRYFALRTMAHDAYLAGNYERSLGISQACLSIYQDTVPLAAIYVRMLMVMDLMSLKQPQEAEALSLMTRSSWRTRTVSWSPLWSIRHCCRASSKFV